MPIEKKAISIIFASAAGESNGCQKKQESGFCRSK
jgi:hypothetical protein